MDICTDYSEKTQCKECSCAQMMSVRFDLITGKYTNN